LDRAFGRRKIGRDFARADRVTETTFHQRRAARGLVESLPNSSFAILTLAVRVKSSFLLGFYVVFEMNAGVQAAVCSLRFVRDSAAASHALQFSLGQFHLAAFRSLNEVISGGNGRIRLGGIILVSAHGGCSSIFLVAYTSKRQ
jgi:hypothetical protein